MYYTPYKKERGGGAMKVEAEIKTLLDGWIRLDIRVTESEYTVYRFTRDEDGKSSMREFDREKVVFEEDPENTDRYKEYFRTVEEAKEKLEEIIKELQEQDKLLKRKAFHEKYEIEITPEEVKWNRKE